MFKQCLIVLGLKMHILQITIFFQEESCLHQRVLFSKYVQVWIVKDIFYMFTYTMWSSCQKTYYEWKGHCMCKRVHVWHRSRLRHFLPMGCSTILKEMRLLKGALTSRRCSTPFQGDHLKCLNMYWLKGLTQQWSISKSVLQIHWLPMVLQCFVTTIWKNT